MHVSGYTVSLLARVTPLPSFSVAKRSGDHRKQCVLTGACEQVTFEGVSPPMPSAQNADREAAPAWPSSLQDTDSEPAMARALSLVLSKCGLARSGLKEPLNPAAAAAAAASALESGDDPLHGAQQFSVQQQQVGDLGNFFDLLVWLCAIVLYLPSRVYPPSAWGNFAYSNGCVACACGSNHG